MRKFIAICLVFMLCISCLFVTAFADESATDTTDETTDTTDDDYASGVLGWFQRLFDGIVELPSKIADAFSNVVKPIIDTLSDIQIRLRNLFDVTSIGVNAVNSLRLVIVQVIEAVMIMPTELQTFAMFSVQLMVGLAIFKLFG